MKSWKRTLFIILAVITVLSLVLSACGPIDGSGNDSDKGNGNDKGKGNDKDKPDNPNKVTICHKTGSAKNPYVEISVANDAANDGHASHEGDIIPAPEDGCPTE